MTNPLTPDFDETRAGFRSGEGTESVLQHLISSARRREKRASSAADSRLDPVPPAEDGGVDVSLPP